MTEQRGNNNHRGGRGRGSGRGGWNGRGERENSNRSKFGSKNTFDRRNNEENKKELSLFKKESKDSKEFKVQLGGDDTEKSYYRLMETMTETKPYSSWSRILI